MDGQKKDIDLILRKLEQTIREFELNKLTSKRFRDLVFGYSKYIKVLHKYGNGNSHNNQTIIKREV